MCIPVKSESLGPSLPSLEGSITAPHVAEGSDLKTINNCLAGTILSVAKWLLFSLGPTSPKTRDSSIDEKDFHLVLLLKLFLQISEQTLLLLCACVPICLLAYIFAIEPLEWWDNTPIINKSSPLSVGDGSILTKFRGKTPPANPNGKYYELIYF